MCTNRPGFQVLCAEQRCVQDALENDVQQLECDSVWVISRVHVGYLLLQLLHTLCLAIYRYHLRRKYKPCLRSIHIKAQMAILFPGRVVHIECRLLCSTVVRAYWVHARFRLLPDGPATTAGEQA